MKPRWPVIVLFITILANRAYSVTLPTHHEYMAVASRHARSTGPNMNTNTSNASIKLTEMRVRSEIALRYARTSVVTRVQNTGGRAQEVTFSMLLPDTAFISGFTMTLGGKSYKAYVKEKEEAQQIYTEAVSQGIGAAHIATKARDSNQFTVTVNVERNSTAIFELKYEEFLVRRNGVYNHAINLHPDAPVPTMEIVVHIKESQKITKLRVPEMRTGNEIDATEKDAQNSKAVIQKDADGREATITFTPDLSEQKRLAQIYVDKTKDKNSLESFIGFGSDEDKNGQDAESTVLGQFVVQYDVERPKNSEILVNDGYFVHFLAPSSLPSLSKHMVFVLDTSSSMDGRKIVQLRKAMRAILSDLNPNDYFNIVEFNSYVKVHELKEADEQIPPGHMSFSLFNQPVTLVPPARASPANIAKAKVIISRLDNLGATNIYSALDVALNLVRVGVRQSNETESINEFAERNGAVASTDDDTRNKRKHLEPIIIFLTDGDPTVGETSTARITTFISEKNSGDKRASLYSLAFGEDADRTFLRVLSLRNEGFMRHIYEAADAALQLHDFYRQVSSPLLAHVRFLYPRQQIKEGSVSRTRFHTINSGSEVVVVGRSADNVTEITPRVVGFSGTENGSGRKSYESSSVVPVNRTKDEYLPLERLWAYLTIKQLLDKRDAGGDNNNADEDTTEQKALNIALKYEFVTPLTSLVVVKPNETNSVDAESVDKPTSDDPNAQPPATAPAGQTPPWYNNHHRDIYNPSYVNGGIGALPDDSAYARQPFMGPPVMPPGYTNWARTDTAYGRGGPAVAPADDSAYARQPFMTPPVMPPGFTNWARTDTAYGRPAVAPDYSNNIQTVAIMTSSKRKTIGNNYYGTNRKAVNSDGRYHDDPYPNSALPDNNGKFRDDPYPQTNVRDWLPGNAFPSWPGTKHTNFDFGQGAVFQNSGWVGYDLDRFTGNGGKSRGASRCNAGLRNIGFSQWRSEDYGDRSATISYEEKYCLNGFDWMTPILDTSTDSLVLRRNGTEVILKLTTEPDPPMGHYPCFNSAIWQRIGMYRHSPSDCVYLSRCGVANQLTVTYYQESYCSVGNGYAGVCCPRTEIYNPSY